jgi:hypothetical protein
LFDLSLDLSKVNTPVPAGIPENEVLEHDPEKLQTFRTKIMLLERYLIQPEWTAL